MFDFRRRESRAEAVARTLLATRGNSRGVPGGGEEDDSYGTRFTMPLPPFSGTSFPIRNSRGETKMKLDGTSYRLYGVILLKNPQGRDLFRMSTRLVDIPDALYVERPNGELAAVVRNAFLSSLHDFWPISVTGSEEMSAVGDIPRQTYSIQMHNGLTIATVARSRRWFRSSLVVDVADSVMAPFILALVVSLDVLSRGRERRPLGSVPQSARSA